MGCTNSKLDDLPAIALCRDRCTFLDEAIQQRYAFSEAHVAYMQSLKSVGASLHHFFDQDLDAFAAATPLSPVLPLPKDRKGDKNPKFVAVEGEFSPETTGLPHHSHSNSGSHLQFHSDSEDDDDDEGSLGSLHHSGNSSPLHTRHNQVDYGMDHDTLSSFPGRFMHMNYMKKQVTPSVSYEQRPMSPETVRMGESSSYYSYNYPNNNNGSYPYYGYSNYGGGDNGYFGPSPLPYGGSTSSPAPQAAASSSKPPPPMPSPERSSAWDFFNPFEYDKNYSVYTPSRDSKEVREEEGIPDLEDEDYQQEVVKEVHGHQKFVDGGGGSGGNYSKSVVNDEDAKVSNNEALYKTRPSVSVENGEIEYEVHMVDKKVVDSNKSEERGNVGAFKGRGGSLGVPEVVREIQVQFERASESGNELAKVLEVGKLQYGRKHGAYQVSSKMLHVITPSLSMVSSQPSTSTDPESSSSATMTGSTLLGIEDAGIKLENLSSTLHKLYLWEKKLYNEVKAEEKIRVIHDRKCQRLKRLDEKGAEAHKVDTTRTLIQSLSTKIRMAIQVVDKISVTINKIRDEELWPRLNDLIQCLTRMWKSMLECHRSQCQVIQEARSLDAIASHKKPSEAQLKATVELEHELIGWTLRFACWVGAHKGYVRALNNWLLKCLLYEPEETPDGIVPFSPGRIGAPPVFVICNQWAQALDRISEKEVVESMRGFARSVLQFWERDKLLVRQSMITNKDMERKVKDLDREDQKIQKEIQALDKRIIMVSGDGNKLSISEQPVYQSDTSSIHSLQASLQHIFEAMERFTANSTRAYEELLQRSEEVVRENAKVS